MSLKEARVTAFTILAIECLLSIFISPQALISFYLAAGFSLFMYKEFFVKEWLSKRIIIYALTHMPVTGLMVLFIYSTMTGGWFWQINSILIIIIIINLLLALSFEVSRKTFALADEKKERDSYSKRLGIPGACISVLILQLAAVGLGAYIGITVQLAPWFFIIGGSIGGGVLLIAILFIVLKTHTWATLFQTSGALFLLLYYILFLVGMIWR